MRKALLKPFKAFLKKIKKYYNNIYMKLNHLLKKNYFKILLTLLLVYLIGISFKSLSKEGFTEADANSPKNDKLKKIYLNSLADQNYLQLITSEISNLKSSTSIDDTEINNLRNYGNISTTAVTSIINLINDIFPNTPHIKINPIKDAEIASSDKK